MTLGLGPDAEQLNAADARDQLVLVEGALHGLDVIATLLEAGCRIGVDALQQQHSRGCISGAHCRHHYPLVRITLVWVELGLTA